MGNNFNGLSCVNAILRYLILLTEGNSPRCYELTKDELHIRMIEKTHINCFE